MDALRYIKIELWNSSTKACAGTHYLPIRDRLYADTSSNTSTANATSSTLPILRISNHCPYTGEGASPYSPTYCLLVTIYNAFGPSATNWFIPPAYTSPTSAFTNNGGSIPSLVTGGGASSGGSGGGGGTPTGGACVDPDALILLSNGSWILAKDVKAGDKVWSVDEIRTDKWREGTVLSSKVASNFQVELNLTVASLNCSWNHRVLTPEGWVPAYQLLIGDEVMTLSGTQKVVSIVPRGSMPVIQMNIDPIHTFISNGIVSHNMKILT